MPAAQLHECFMEHLATERDGDSTASYLVLKTALEAQFGSAIYQRFAADVRSTLRMEDVAAEREREHQQVKRAAAADRLAAAQAAELTVLKAAEARRQRAEAGELYRATAGGGVVSFTRGQWTYSVDVATLPMVQTNRSTGKGRRVRRRNDGTWECACEADKGWTAYAAAQATALEGAYICGADQAPPTDWQEQRGDVQTFNVLQGTPEYARVCERFKGRDFSCSVVEVLRVQNRDLWKEYAFRRRRTAELNDGDPNELLDLKHGTSRTAPGEVYGCRQGLDSRFSETGYYGRGLYLAEEASYVDGGYRHTLDAAARLHQMLLVRASVGTPEQRAGQDRSIKMPVVGRHTVRGPVRGHQQAYVCYELYMAYPEYLITYVSQ